MVSEPFEWPSTGLKFRKPTVRPRPDLESASGYTTCKCSRFSNTTGACRGKVGGAGGGDTGESGCYPDGYSYGASDIFKRRNYGNARVEAGAAGQGELDLGRWAFSMTEKTYDRHK